MVFPFSLTLISAVVEDIESLHCLLASLLVAKDEVNPLMEVTGDMLTFLGENTQRTSLPYTIHQNWCHTG